MVGEACRTLASSEVGILAASPLTGSGIDAKPQPFSDGLWLHWRPKVSVICQVDTIAPLTQ